MTETVDRSFDTDLLLESVWFKLGEDFSSYDESVFSDLRLHRLFGGSFRELPHRGCFLSKPEWLRRRIQLENFFKRWTFQHEVSLQKTREEACFKKFIDIQARFDSRGSSLRESLVIQLARKYAKRILGPYNADEHVELCSFSHNATTKSPRHRSDPDQKLSGPITTSLGQHSWFIHTISDDPILSDVCQRDRIEIVDRLTYVTVPKKWDIDRGIMPNTTVGSYYTSGLGKMIRRRLRDFGLNIRHLPDRHNIIAKRCSIDRRLVTADLSSASDCFTSSLINRIVPREWYNVLKLGRISNFEYDGKVYNMTSFMTMGIGFTFELETLLFYCILRAVQELLASKGQISVYGDDLIYPSEMHPYVHQIFNDIGFKLNDDKTFVKENFRESCGGDYYCGLSVRPQQPQGVGRLELEKPFCAFCYKCLNGLLERFSKEEIPKTYDFLIDVISQFGPVFQVPVDYPDFSGVHTMKIIWDDPRFSRVWLSEQIDKELKDIHVPTFQWSGYVSLSFKSLSESHHTRPVKDHRMYVWNTLHESYLMRVDPDIIHPFRDSLLDKPPIIVWRPKTIQLPYGRRKRLWVARVKERRGTLTVTSKTIPMWMWPEV